MKTVISNQDFHVTSIDQISRNENGSKQPNQLPINIDAVRLTKKEKLVLEMASTGMSQKEVANKLNRSLPTIAKQWVAAIKKMGAKNMTEAAVMAVRQGVIFTLVLGFLGATSVDFMSPRGSQRTANQQLTRRSENVC